MEELLHSIQELLRTLYIALKGAFDLGFALLDFFWTSSISLPALSLLGISVVAFLLGLLVGRVSKRGVRTTLDNPRQIRDERVVLDLDRLRPLGRSVEEEEETKAMDISTLRPDERGEGIPRGSASQRRQTGTPPERP